MPLGTTARPPGRGHLAGGGPPLGGRRAGQPESESAPDFWGGGSGEEELEE